MIFDSPDASSIFDTQGYLSTYHVQPDLLDYKNKIIILLVKFLNHVNGQIANTILRKRKISIISYWHHYAI